MAYRSFDFQPDKDAGLGLIYRLNNLWAMVDRKMTSANFEDANHVLDRIYCNLLYRHPLEITEDKDGNIEKVDLDEEDAKIHRYFEETISAILKKQNDALRRNDRVKLVEAKSELYETLRMKDIWLRKMMQKLKLYLKESDNNPSRAMFGGK